MRNISFLVLFCCFSGNLFAQDTQREQIDKTIRAYFEGYMTGNIQKLAIAFDTTSANLYANKLENGKWKIQIELPKSITGNLVWKGKKIPLKEGVNNILI